MKMGIYKVNIKIFTKNFKKINNFFNFLKKLKQKLKIKFIVKSNYINLKKKKYDVLRSPHVHKTSQEQFCLKNYKINLLLTCFIKLNNLILFIKLFNKYFNEIYFKFELFITSTKKHDNINFLFDPNKFTVTNKKKTIHYLQLFELYGKKL